MLGQIGETMSERPEGIEFASIERRPPRPTTTMTLTRNGENGIEVLLGLRADTMPAFPGFWAFPGGGLSRVDSTSVDELPQLDGEHAKAVAAMSREMVEELGFAWDGKKLISVDLESRRKVIEDKSNWLPLVKSGKIPCSQKSIKVISRRITPPFAPVSFDNVFLHLHAGEKKECPQFDLEEQTEFVDAMWDTPSNIFEKWMRHEIKVAPPVVSLLHTFIKMIAKHGNNIEPISAELSFTKPGKRAIWFAYGVEVLPVQTATLPPATHTNCYIVGEPDREFILVDPAIKLREDMEKLANAVDRHGGEMKGILFTHGHSDHLADWDLLREAFDAPIWSSKETAKTIEASKKAVVSKIITDGELIHLGDVSWTALHTPGHDPGHICLHSPAGLVAGDMVAGIGTILIPPHSGNMEVYLEQLKRLKQLNPHLIFPSHGPIIPLPQKKLNYYIKHRGLRNQRILEALQEGLEIIEEIAYKAYEDSPNAHPGLALDQTLSHLMSLRRTGRVIQKQNKWKIGEN